jgi:hypothetical protein
MLARCKHTCLRAKKYYEQVQLVADVLWTMTSRLLVYGDFIRSLHI